MSRASFHKAGGKEDPLQKKVPKNPKYKNVKSTLDTGASITRYLAKIDDIRTNYRYRKDEIFKRMKLTTFVQLALQVAEINALNEDARDFRPDTGDTELPEGGDNYSARGGDSYSGRYSSRQSEYSYYGEDTHRSTLHSVVSGVGEIALNEPEAAPEEPVDASVPYLLLDLRTPDEYDQCHIITATSYPSAMLSRAQNFETREMLEARNKKGRIIVVYDDDERLAPRCATTLVQRGYDNVFMLSGGMKVAWKLFPTNLVTGTPPEAVTGKRVTGPVTPAAQPQFSLLDLEKLHEQLDMALEDRSIGGSRSGRLSKTSTSTSRSAASQQSVRSTSSDKPPFKP